jgi:hypothetical protein
MICTNMVLMLRGAEEQRVRPVRPWTTAPGGLDGGGWQLLPPVGLDGGGPIWSVVTWTAEAGCRACWCSGAASQRGVVNRGQQK